MLRTNYLRNKLGSGKAVIGTWAAIPSPVTADVIAISGMDFVVIDSEHGPISFETAQNMIMAVESREVSPCVRVSGLVEGDILKALDIGAHCIHIPNIMTRNDAEQAVQMSKYPPIGKRGFSPFTRAGNYSLESAKVLTKKANENTLVAIHIEGKEAIDNIDEILKIKGIDIVFIGIFDLSKSLGIAGDVENPKVVAMLKEIAKKASKAGKYPGSIVNNNEQLKKFLGYGIKYITYSVDCDVFSGTYKKIVSNFRKVSK
ncbi:HpcH/HpaI aldolase/citrate lyase family protein [Candidatus Margulisiibacteriota bacterium]